ncbi:hypothetical protein [Gordonia otitidis]|uniref:Uncharacterized protein n=1 Tax=Gordonia otitidis (strain DSM 44809 / CCUG 52243 / JCM 12355 / NBRC 100426 / IFM 10032) TaxID=1108044 RepID=H5TSD1_GORO1|nr:hypothetical protein [Gordonia otitidis]GAB36389.1 hypothetical protein GOOTI_214_00150 [Gordonia otitidis NBRC 100426]
MKSDLPVSATVNHGNVTTTAPFADQCDAVAFIHAQARTATQMGHKQFTATLTRSDGATVATVDVSGHDIGGQVIDALGSADQGLTYLRVAGIDALVYAHRSCKGDGVLFVGVDADDDQRILFAVNDGDLVDTVVGDRTGSIDVTYDGGGPQTVSCVVDADSPAEAQRILEAAVCCQPLHFTSHTTAAR